MTIREPMLEEMGATRRQVAPAIAGAVAVAAVGLPAFWLLAFGPLATHMALHIALMSVAAPLVAILLVELGFARSLGPKWLAGSTFAQILMLWAIHAPGLQGASAAAWLSVLLWALLIASAVAFWLSVCSGRRAQPWQAIVGLLFTGKLACLLGALLVFAPRTIYAGGHHGFDLADQQMAGLLMLAACPLSYVLAGIVIAVQALFAPGGRTDTALNRPILARQTA